MVRKSGAVKHIKHGPRVVFTANPQLLTVGGVNVSQCVLVSSWMRRRDRHVNRPVVTSYLLQSAQALSE